MKALFQETLNFLKETNDKALKLQRQYDDFPRDLGAYELDFENFIAEITVVCTGYEHIKQGHDPISDACQGIINAGVGRDNTKPPS